MNFENIIEDYGDKILRLCYLKLGSMEEAEDATQEILINIYKSLNKFKGNSSLSTWIYKITVNHCYNKRKRKWRFSFENIDNHNFLQSNDCVEDEVLFDFESNNLSDALSSVDEKYRIPLYLYYYESLKIKDIAKVLDQSENTIKTKLKRGKEILRAIILEEGN